jgi:hypothetical protein
LCYAEAKMDIFSLHKRKIEIWQKKDTWWAGNLGDRGISSRGTLIKPLTNVWFGLVWDECQIDLMRTECSQIS